jgi:hypothetical protein
MGWRGQVIRFGVTVAVATTGLLAQAPLDAAEQARVIAGMREASMAFDRNLPNFICTQTTHREIRFEPDLTLGIRTSGRGQVPMPQSNRTGQWERVDSYEEQLSYFDHRESYSLVKMNGKPVKKKQDRPAGLSSSGEFGSTLIHIFEAESKTEFEWKRAETLRGRPVDVFAFKIAKENSAAEMTAGSQRIVVGYHGFVYADHETNTVLRVTTEADTPPDFPLQNVTHVLDYGKSNIAGESFLLPLHSEMQTRASEDFMKNGRIGPSAKQATMRNTVDFGGYRKYSAESTLKPE